MYSSYTPSRLPSAYRPTTAFVENQVPTTTKPPESEVQQIVKPEQSRLPKPIWVDFASPLDLENRRPDSRYSWELPNRKMLNRYF
jgi:hypothetical protein